MLGLVTDGVLHRIGKVQPLLIGWNAPDRVERSGVPRLSLFLNGVTPLRGYYTGWEVVQCSLTGVSLLLGLTPRTHGLVASRRVPQSRT